MGGEIKIRKNFVVVESLRKSFGELSVLDDISFQISNGKIVSFLGPSGCGKSTLLNIIAGLLEADSGVVKLDGKKSSDFLGTGKISFVFQDDALLPWYNVLQNTLLPLELNGKPNFVDKENALNLLKLVGLYDFQKHFPHELSGGMKRRLSLARALISNPSLAILDEPFGALDEVLRRELMLEIEEIWAEQKITTIVVTHSISEAIFLSDEIHLLSNRPARIIDTVYIDHERPRRIDFLKSKQFQDMSNNIFDMLLEKKTS